ncbi:hypothetical protein L9F63_023820, partial [Diploptera punctata]
MTVNTEIPPNESTDEAEIMDSTTEPTLNSSRTFSDVKITYDKHKIYSLVPHTDNQTFALRILLKNPKGLKFLTFKFVKGREVRIMVSEEKYHILEKFTKKHGFIKKVVVHNVQHLINAQVSILVGEEFSFHKYYGLVQIYEYMKSLVSVHYKYVTHLVIGNSYEGRAIRGVKISYKKNNPGVFIEAGTHAREWIAPATALYIINELLTSKDRKIRSIAENYDFYIFPCVNPDGYEYSHQVDRMWRKTRRPITERCTGVDANRNFGFHFEADEDDHCSEIYPGPHAFSEPETKHLADFVKRNRKNIQVYLDFHSFSQLLMFPYGYTYDHVPNYDQLYRIGRRAAAALKSVYGTEYGVGDIAEAICKRDNISLDYMYGELGIPFCYVYELRDKGQTGMLLPPEQIIPTGRETLASIIAMLQDTYISARIDHERKKIETILDDIF